MHIIFFGFVWVCLFVFSGASGAHSVTSLGGASKFWLCLGLFIFCTLDLENIISANFHGHIRVEHVKICKYTWFQQNRFTKSKKIIGFIMIDVKVVMDYFYIDVMGVYCKFLFAPWKLILELLDVDPQWGRSRVQRTSSGSRGQRACPTIGINTLCEQ